MFTITQKLVCEIIHQAVLYKHGFLSNWGLVYIYWVAVSIFNEFKISSKCNYLVGRDCPLTNHENQETLSYNECTHQSHFDCHGDEYIYKVGINF